MNDKAVEISPEDRDWLSADLDGDLDLALSRARIAVLRAGQVGEVRQRIDALLILARMLRHRADPASVQEAMSTATIATRLTLLSANGDEDLLHGRAELESAACLVQAGRVNEGLERAQPWRDHPEARLAGWAWAVIGEALSLQDAFSASVAAYANAVAEFQRWTRPNRESGTKIKLAEVLSRGGQVAAAAAVLDELEDWRDNGPPARLLIEYYLALAEVQQAQGDVGAALETLVGKAWPLLVCRGALVALRIRYHLRSAEYLTIWDQVVDAAKHKGQAEELRRRLPSARPAAEHLDNPVPGWPESRRLDQRDADVARDFAGEVRHALDSVRLPEQIRHVFALLEAMQGRPDAERAEVSMLIEAGEKLAPPRGATSLYTERCLRRALVRAAWLPGMDLWRARGQFALARVLSDAGQSKEALDLAVEAVQTLDEQRFKMRQRNYRSNWLQRSIHPAFELAIELAIRCGETHVAADLIIFSRAAGVVVAVEGSGQRLLPVPQLHYIDGGESILGSGGECFLI